MHDDVLLLNYSIEELREMNKRLIEMSELYAPIALQLCTRSGTRDCFVILRSNWRKNRS
jgi:hypothetical protein